jgi:hypothetical protein
MIAPGSKVLARSAFGDLLPKRATSGPTEGVDFEVIWLCSEAEWEAAESEGRDPDARPWPTEAVVPT